MADHRRFCGREFSVEELDWIAALAARREAGLTRQAISIQVCEKLNWRKPDGGLKDMSARVALLRMHRQGLIELPPVARKATGSKPKSLTDLPETDWPHTLFPLPTSLDEVRPLRFEIIRMGPRSRIWNSYIERYHYLGYSPLPGAQMRYLIRSCDGEPVALLGFGAAAWKTAPRDLFIGWSEPCRKRNLQRVVNNARFLILPWIRITNLASHILASCEKRLAADWQQRYAIQPVLLETFCEIPRFRGTCYQAANWIKVGQTTGRGKLSRSSKATLPKKDIYLKPLERNWKSVLNF